MKTLAKPRPDSIIAISTDRLISSTIVGSHKNHLRNDKKIISYFLLIISFSTFLFFPESPKLSESICKSYNNEFVCNVW